jgi:hypothetical protein
MTTAVESTLRPMDAMKMEKMRIHRLNPRNSMSFLIPSMVATGLARSIMENRSFKKLRTGAMMGHLLVAALRNPSGLLVFSTK